MSVAEESPTFGSSPVGGGGEVLGVVTGVGRIKGGGSHRVLDRGVTLFEVLLSLTILAMMSMLIYGVFEGLSRSRKSEAARSERTRQARAALDRVTREMQGAFLSLHQPPNQVQWTRMTGFMAKGSSTTSRVDFTAFAHRRVDTDAKESDQAEIGYFVVRDPKSPDDKFDLVRREQTPIDTDIAKGGIVQVIAEDVEEFHLSFFDPANQQWTDTWDSSMTNMHFGRIPLEVRVTLVLKERPPSKRVRLTTKFMLPLQQPLSFGVPR